MHRILTEIKKYTEMRHFLNGKVSFFSFVGYLFIVISSKANQFHRDSKDMAVNANLTSMVSNHSLSDWNEMLTYFTGRKLWLN